LGGLITPLLYKGDNMPSVHNKKPTKGSGYDKKPKKGSGYDKKPKDSKLAGASKKPKSKFGSYLRGE
jgi:hypothetical protein